MDGYRCGVGGDRAGRSAAAAAATASAATVAFKPNQRGGIGDQPTQAARAGVDRILFIRGSVRSACPAAGTTQRYARLFLEHLSGAVPDFDLRGKLPGGVRIREWFVNVGHDDVLPIGRHARRFDHPGLADWRRGARHGIHDRELRRGVILEQILIVGILQHVLKGWSALASAETFGDVGACRHSGRDGGGAAIRGHSEHQQGFAVGRPLQRAAASTPATASAGSAATAAEDFVQMQVRQFVRASGGGVADPDLDAGLRRIREQEAFAVRAPGPNPQFRIRRQSDLDLGPFGNLAQHQARLERGVVQAIRLRVNPDAGQTQHRLGEFGDGRITNRASLERICMVGTQQKRGGGG